MERKLLIENLNIGYHHADGGRGGIVFENINAAVGEGEMVALLGRNGVGKSTFLRTLAGLQKPLGGVISLCGKLLPDYTMRELAAMVSFVSTASLRVPYLKLFDLVAMGRFPYTGWMGRLSVQDKKRVDEAMQMVGIGAMAARAVDTLSDGERQRSVIARALVQDTPVMILDEPTAFLDTPNKYEIVQLLRKLAREQKKIILFSTHELSLAMHLADKLWVMTSKGLTGGIASDEPVQNALHDMFAGSSVSFWDVVLS